MLRRRRSTGAAPLDQPLRRRAAREQVGDDDRDQASQHGLHRDRPDRLPQIADAVERRRGDERQGRSAPDERARHAAAILPRRAKAPTTSASTVRIARTAPLLSAP